MTTCPTHVPPAHSKSKLTLRLFRCMCADRLCRSVREANLSLAVLELNCRDDSVMMNPCVADWTILGGWSATLSLLWKVRPSFGSNPQRLGES